MALEIGGATIGYDSNGLRKTYQNLKTSCVDETKAKMKLWTVTKIKPTLEKAWKGTSADMFYGNFVRDIEYVEKGLNDALAKLENQFEEIIKQMNAKEDKIVAKRSGGRN